MWVWGGETSFIPADLRDKDSKMNTDAKRRDGVVKLVKSFMLQPVSPKSLLFSPRMSLLLPGCEVFSSLTRSSSPVR